MPTIAEKLAKNTCYGSFAKLIWKKSIARNNNVITYLFRPNVIPKAIDHWLVNNLDYIPVMHISDIKHEIVFVTIGDAILFEMAFT